MITRLASCLNINADGSAARRKAQAGGFGKRCGGRGRRKERSKFACSTKNDREDDDNTCCYCVKYGQWAREWRKKKRDEAQAQANLT